MIIVIAANIWLPSGNVNGFVDTDSLTLGFVSPKFGDLIKPGLCFGFDVTTVLFPIDIMNICLERRFCFRH